MVSEYTIDISGLDWADPVTKATSKTCLALNSPKKVSMSVTTATWMLHKRRNITITGGD